MEYCQPAIPRFGDGLVLVLPRTPSGVGFIDTGRSLLPPFGMDTYNVLQTQSLQTIRLKRYTSK